jgi:hypothetical protein
MMMNDAKTGSLNLLEQNDIMQIDVISFHCYLIGSRKIAYNDESNT